MTAGTSSLLRGRFLLALLESQHRLNFHLSTHAHTWRRLQSSCASDTMLGRAHNAFEAKPPQPRIPPLAKQLFPSSSPVQHANIQDSFKRTSQPSHKSDTPVSSIPHQKGASVTSLTASRPKAPSKVPMASLYNQPDSFQDSPDDLVEIGSRAKTAVATEVLFFEDDFSDDTDLDLDYQEPTKLPLPPPTISQKPSNEIHETTIPFSSRSENIVPWSSSPPSHMLPSHSLSTRIALSTRTSKRSSLGEAELPPPKKRSLPRDWTAQPRDDSKLGLHGESTPERKIKDPMPWNTTASAVKAQKKHHKDTLKRSGTNEEYTMEEVRAVTAMDSERVKGISLSKEQERVQDLVVNKGQSVFFTGPAGTGKSVLMRSIVAELRKKFAKDPERLAVTASTGLAACNIGGQTLHSFSGIGLGKEEVPVLVKKIRRNPKAKNRWLRTKVLILDEVSMVDGDLFDKLSAIGRQLRNNGRPWGGIQLVITGDFFQLPPVPDTGGGKRESKFAFDAATWNTSIDHTIGLTQVFRQKDPVFAGMLNEMRLGVITDETVRAFKALSRPIMSNDDLDLETTELFPTRQEVEGSNQTRLRNLPGKAKRYDAHETGDPQLREKLLANVMAPKSIELKVGAQVMLVKNMDETLVNGSLGRVRGFMTESMFELKNDTAFGTDDEGAPDAKVQNRIKAFTRELEESRTGATEYPVVEFSASDGTHRTILCIGEEYKVENAAGEVQACRRQIPLILAWALSIHKAQGQTLERVKVDLGKVFEKGQAYVALSRATTQQGLQVLRFEKHKVMAHPRVVNFYNNLYSIDEAMAKKPAVTVASIFSAPKAKELGSRSTFQTNIRPTVQKPIPRAVGSARAPITLGDDDDDEDAMAEVYGH